jgi:hypothetical protein
MILVAIQYRFGVATKAEEHTLAAIGILRQKNRQTFIGIGDLLVAKENRRT